MCLFPWRATRETTTDHHKGISVNTAYGRPKADPEGELFLPCGKCDECISKRAVEWATRASHEISDHDENCFLTLTYDDEHLPSFLIVKSEFQKFMKRLRKKTKCKLRYMVSHEYGGKSGRPHHHAIIFGYNPPNQVHIMDAPSGEPLFTSKEINELWRNGYHSIGTANEKTAYYIASYSLKSNKHNITDPATGIIHTVSDSMDASKRPAIGRNYFEKNYQQLINTKASLPRYYQKLLEKHYPQIHQQYQNNQQDQIIDRSAHQKYAKYIITQQQLDNSENTYRKSHKAIHQQKQYEYHLRYHRDNYVEKTRKNS